MRRSIQNRGVWLLCVLLLTCNPTTRAHYNDGIARAVPLWTAKLKRFGFRTFRHGLVNDYGSQASIAFSADVVAAVFDAKSEERDDRGGVTRALGLDGVSSACSGIAELVSFGLNYSG